MLKGETKGRTSGERRVNSVGSYTIAQNGEVEDLVTGDAFSNGKQDEEAGRGRSSDLYGIIN